MIEDACMEPNVSVFVNAELDAVWKETVVMTGFESIISEFSWRV